MRLLTTDEVAEMTGLSRETLAQWRWLKKELPLLSGLEQNVSATGKAILTRGSRKD